MISEACGIRLLLAFGSLLWSFAQADYYLFSLISFIIFKGPVFRLRSFKDGGRSVGMRQDG